MRITDLRKINAILLFIIALSVIMYYGAGFLTPLAFAAFLAFLVSPISGWIERMGLPRWASSTISTLIVFVVISGLMGLMVNQMRVLASDLPEMEDRIKGSWEDIQTRSPFEISLDAEGEGGKESGSNGIIDMVKGSILGFVGGSLTIMAKFLLTLIYLFLLLINRHHYDRFILMYTKKEDEQQTKKVMHEAGGVAHQYLWGRLQVMIILGTAYIITFLLFDVPYALLLTIFGTLVTIIPYIGPFVSGTVPILLMLASGRDMNTVLAFAGIVMVIQLIESYVLEPLLLASAVQISPLTVILAVIIGGAVWGVGGMILMVPIFAIAKIFFDHTQGLRPLGYLLGQEKQGKIKMSSGGDI